MKQATVKCPSCGKSVRWADEERWRPFCSERCRLLDLGAWADGSNAIPGELADMTPGIADDDESVPH